MAHAPRRLRAQLSKLTVPPSIIDNEWDGDVSAGIQVRCAILNIIHPWDWLIIKGMPVTVLVVEDHLPFRGFISTALNKKRNLQIICEVSDGLEAIQKAVQLKPDMILLDIGLPTLNGIEVARQIRRVVPESKIIFLTSECDAVVVQTAFSLGASGYVVKTMAGSDLLSAMEAVISGKQFASIPLGDLHDLTSLPPELSDDSALESPHAMPLRVH